MGRSQYAHACSQIEGDRPIENELVVALCDRSFPKLPSIRTSVNYFRIYYIHLAKRLKSAYKSQQGSTCYA